MNFLSRQKMIAIMFLYIIKNIMQKNNMRQEQELSPLNISGMSTICTVL